jgi:hypothetical protein
MKFTTTTFFCIKGNPEMLNLSREKQKQKKASKKLKIIY